MNAEANEKSPLDSLDGPPFVTCKAWAIVDGESGEFLAGDHEDEKRDPASTTKIMTAYLVTLLGRKGSEGARRNRHVLRAGRQNVRLDVRRESGRESCRSANCSTACCCRPATTRPSHLPSISASGWPTKRTRRRQPNAYDSFIAAMNRKAAEIGMKSTHFNNPHGLPSDGHQTTARDLAQLAFAAFQVPEFRKRVETPQHGYTVDSVSGYQRNVVWQNTNQLLRIEGYDGIKTGTTGAAGQLPRLDRRARRPAVDRRRARRDVDRIAVRRRAQSLSLGVERSG